MRAALGDVHLGLDGVKNERAGSRVEVDGRHAIAEQRAALP